MTTPEETDALTYPVSCPICGAAPNVWCVGPKGGRVKALHPRRFGRGEGWRSRQAEVDTLTQDVKSGAADLASAKENQLALEARLAQTLSDLSAEQTAHSHTRDVSARVIADLRATVADLQAQISPWELHHTYDLTRDEGWTINTGPRPTVDSSVGRRENVTWNPLTLTAQRAGSLITSCDIISKHAPLPVHFALELDGRFDGLGPGMFPCLAWFKTIEGGGGELDGHEYLSALATSQWPAYIHKMTAIALPAKAPLQQLQVPLRDVMERIDPTKPHGYRWEKTPGRFEMFIDGTSYGALTREAFDAKWGKGLWDANFEDPSKHWYTRHTWQVGPRGDGKPGGMGSPVPADWTKSTMTITRMVAYRLK